MLEPIRRVVTGHSTASKSLILFDGTVRPGPDLPTDAYLWVSDATPASNRGLIDAAARSVKLAPPKGGSVFRFVSFPPASAFAAMSPEEIERVMAGLFEQLGATDARVDMSRGPGMHRTHTLDYIVLLSGELTLVLDEGEVDLKPFDVVVQRGTNHGWVNKGQTPALVAAVMIDAEPI